MTCEDIEPVKAYGDGIHFGQVENQVTFRVNADSKPTIRIDGPDTSPPAKIETERQGVYLVTFVPREIGVFDVQVIVGDREILGEYLCVYKFLNLFKIYTFLSPSVIRK